MSEHLFRALEIIAVLLPLTGIFITMSYRMASELGLDLDRTEMKIIQVLLLVGGSAFALSGTLTAAILTVTTGGFLNKVVFLVLYVGLLLISIAMALLYVVLIDSVSPSPGQQTLSDPSNNTSNEE